MIEDRIYQQWLVAYANMTKENFITFSDYLKKLKKPSASSTMKTDEEIIDDAENILNMFKRS